MIINIYEFLEEFINALENFYNRENKDNKV